MKTAALFYTLLQPLCQQCQIVALYMHSIILSVVKFLPSLFYFWTKYHYKHVGMQYTYADSLQIATTSLQLRFHLLLKQTI